MLDRLLSVPKRIWSHRVVRFIIYVITTYIIFNAIGGVIGNTTYLGSPPVWMRDTWEQVSNLFITHLLFITSFTSGTGLIILCFIWSRILIINRALNATASLVELDDTLLRLTTNLLIDYKTKTREQLMKEMLRLLNSFLEYATQTVLGKRKRGRAAILFPNLPHPNEEFLTVIAKYRLPPISEARMKFYVGKDENKEGERGTIGVVYLNKKMCLAHIVQKQGFPECDDENFINFDEGRARLPYQTLVNIPIIGLATGGNTDCLGVICMDSLIPNAFDSQRAKTLLEAIATRAAAVLTIYIQLFQAQNYTAPYFDRVL